MVLLCTRYRLCLIMCICECLCLMVWRILRRWCCLKVGHRTIFLKIILRADYDFPKDIFGVLVVVRRRLVIMILTLLIITFCIKQNIMASNRRIPCAFRPGRRSFLVGYSKSSIPIIADINNWCQSSAIISRNAKGISGYVKNKVLEHSQKQRNPVRISSSRNALHFSESGGFLMSKKAKAFLHMFERPNK